MDTKATSGAASPPKSSAPETPLAAWESPFKDLTPQQVGAFFADFGAHHRAKSHDEQRALTRLLGKVDSVSLLAYLADMFLAHPEDVDPEHDLHSPFLQAHLEFLQACCITLDRTDGMGPSASAAPFIALATQAAQHTITLMEAITFGRTPEDPQSLSEQEKSLFLLQETIRTHTQAVRNWGFPNQMDRILNDIFGALDESFANTIGVEPTALLGMLRNMISLAEDRRNSRRRNMRDFIHDPVISEMTSVQMHVLLVENQFLGYSDDYTFHTDDLISCYPSTISASTMSELMSKWSHEYGDLSSEPLERIILNNPVWRKPFIRLDGERYYCPILGVLHSFVLPLILELAIPHPALVDRYHRRRDKYLEDHTSQLFRTYLPSASVFQGSQWRDPASGIQYENDILVVLDGWAIVVETKAGKVPLPAMRGAPDTLASTMQRLVVEATTQGQRFIDYLKGNPGPHSFTTQSGGRNNFDSSTIEHFLNLNVTFELFGVLSERSAAFREAGLVGANQDMAPTMSLVDLEVVLDMLDGEIRRLHYLKTRHQYEGLPQLGGDELDLLAFYLQDAESRDDIAKVSDPPYIQIQGLSANLNKVYPMPRAQRPSDWRRTRLSRLWSELLTSIGARHPSHWLSTSIALLDYPFRFQQHVDQREIILVEKIRKSPEARAVREAHIHKNGYASYLIVATKGLSEDEQLQYCKEQLDSRVKQFPDRTWMVIVTGDDRAIQAIEGERLIHGTQ